MSKTASTSGTPLSKSDAELDAESKYIETEVNEYGGDAPESRRNNMRAVERSRSYLGAALTKRLTTGSLGPSLHLTDSAFEGVTRVLSQQIEQQGGGVDSIDTDKVTWEENDPENPQNWTDRYKIMITSIVILLTVNITFASTAPSSATDAFAADLNTTEEIATLVTSIFLFSYCLGPIMWAPLSELFGRRVVFIATVAGFAIFQIGQGLAQNITTLLIIRFISGVLASSPLSNAGGVIADIWDVVGRGTAMSLFSASVFIGPVIGPIVGGYLTTSYLTWRWIFWIQGIFALLCLVIVAVLLPETFAPVLLARRAKRLRKEDPIKNATLYAELERTDFSVKAILTRTLMRPFIMLREPILFFVTIYMSIIYGLLYALFSIYPLVFAELRGFSNGEVGLAFIGVGIGTTLGAVINIGLQRHYKVLAPKWHGHPPPEERLWGAIVAGPFLVVGIFFFGWTGQFASISWIVPVIASIILGISFTLVFISFLTYLIDVYLMYAASALAANTIVRSAFGGALPLFATQMFTGLGIGWACSLIGFLALFIVPVPVLFYWYGARLRAGSDFAPCIDLMMKERVEREEEDAIAHDEKKKLESV